jgi:hypothetical protein
MGKIKIEYNIPVPNEHASRIKYAYLFENMEKPTKKRVASFIIKAGDKPKFKARNLYQSAVNFCRLNKLDWKFTYRITGYGKRKKIRIWRIK